MSNKPLLIESHYLGSLPYYASILAHPDVLIDAHEHFVKASYRNRCHIATPDGLLVLSIPLARGRGQRRRMKEITAFNVEPWQDKHWNSLCSAYRRSPYFEYYEDDFEPFFKKPVKNILDFNTELMVLVLKMLKLEVRWNYTDTYIGKDDPSVIDMRSALMPIARKTRLPEQYTTPKYHQVFDDRNPFFADLSILDLLYNEGPRAGEILLDSWRD